LNAAQAHALVVCVSPASGVLLQKSSYIFQQCAPTSINACNYAYIVMLRLEEELCLKTNNKSTGEAQPQPITSRVSNVNSSFSRGEQITPPNAN
jgi:hypothetical protein